MGLEAMYKQIDSNRFKSRLLIAVFIGVLACTGYAYGLVTDSGYSGLVLALVISLSMSLVSWFWGDSIALATAHAKQLTSRDQNPTVWNLVENLCITAGQPMPRIFLIDDTAPNAFATGRSPDKSSIAITTGLLDILERPELEGVISHELSHIKNEDTKIMVLAAILVGSITLLGDWFIRGSLFGRRSRNNKDFGGIFMIIGFVFLLLSPVIAQLIQLAISRKREYLADASGALLTRYPEGLARALEKIRDRHEPVEHAPTATAHLWIANPLSGTRLSSLFATHPPIDDRIQELRRMSDAR